jgi:hypothetical protein
MYHYFVILATIYLTIQLGDAPSFEAFILTPNNTGIPNWAGPSGRARPVLMCYPAYPDGPFPKCFVVSGSLSDPFPHVFYNDIWRMNIDINTKTVQWIPLHNSTELPYETRGIFHQSWKHNATAFSVTAGLNDLSFTATCSGQNIITYDYINQRYETTVPIGGNWNNLAGGACGRYKDDVYCFGGFDCNTLEDSNSWTKYNIPMSSWWDLSGTTTNHGSVSGRSMSSVTCFEDKQFCVIGSGNSIFGGTKDDWVMYDRDNNIFIPRGSNHPVGIEYLTPDNSETWRINDNGEFQVVNDKRKMLVVGGDQASGTIEGASETIRYVAEFNVNGNGNNNWKFHPITPTMPIAGQSLFTIKQEYLRNIPRVRCDSNTQGKPCDVNSENDDKCSYFIEFGGWEENSSVSRRYPDSVVLYKWCD